jgi:hypothetical protein
MLLAEAPHKETTMRKIAPLSSAIFLAICCASAQAENASIATPYGSVASASVAKPGKSPVRLPAEASIVQADKANGSCLLTLETLEGGTFQAGADPAVCSAFASAQGSLMNLTYTLLEEPAEPYASIPGIHQHWLIIEGSKAPAAEGTLCQSGERALFSCMLADRNISACSTGASSGVFGGKVWVRQQIAGQVSQEDFPTSKITGGYSSAGATRGSWLRFSRPDGTGTTIYAGADFGSSSTPKVIHGVESTKTGTQPSFSHCLGMAQGEIGQDWIEHAKIARDQSPELPR